MSKAPSFQFYPADWRKDLGIQSLTYHDRGVWFEILCLMHESQQRGRLIIADKPMSDDMVARLLGLDKQSFLRTLTTLLDSGVASRGKDGELVSRRMLRDEHLRQIRAEAGKKGGNPNLVKQNSTTRVKQNPTPSSSSSPSGIDLHKDAGEWEYPIKELVEAFPHLELTPAMVGFLQGSVKVGDEAAWAKTIEIYRMNFDPTRNRYLPEKTANLLGVFTSEKAKLEKGNAITGQSTRPHRATTAERIAAGRNRLSKYASETEAAES